MPYKFYSVSVVVFAVVVFCHSDTVVMGEFLFRAQDLEMTNGDYVFLTMTTATIDDDKHPWLSFNMTGQNLTYRMEAFYAVKEVRATVPLHYYQK